MSKASEESLEGVARHINTYGDDFVGVFASFGDEAIESVTKYSDDAISAMKNGIEPKLISSLDELGVAPSQFTSYGIVSKATAETTETAIKAYGTDAVVDVITKYNKNAFTALDNGLSPTLINSLDNLGINPSKFKTYGITSKEAAEVTETLVTTYGDNVITALDNGIEPTLIKSLDDLQITPAEFTQYKITSKTAAEATENAINQGSVKTWKAFFADNVGKYGFESAKEASDDYLELLTNQSPWPKGYTPTDKVLSPGETVYFIVDSDTALPGAWGSNMLMSSVEDVRNILAVKTTWKQNANVVLECKIKDNLSFDVIVKEGTVGPQIEVANGIDEYYPGGAWQYDFTGLPDGLRTNDVVDIVNTYDLE